MKITMYELLGLVKDGKAPKKIKYVNSIWEYDKETKDYFHDDLWLIYSMNSIGLTEREVEILEEEKKIPEKSILDVDSDVNESYDIVIINDAEYEINKVERYMLGKINEIIDYLKSKGDE